MRLGYEQILQQTQKLVMTPELIQSIQILQYTSQELREYVEQELLENPMIEPSSEFEFANEKAMPMYEEVANRMMKDSYYEKSFKVWENAPDDDSDFSFEKYVSKEITLYDFLSEQLTFADISIDENHIGEYIINDIDDNGYLRSSTDEISQVLSVPVDRVERVIKVIQGFEPFGVGARNLKECLMIQLEHNNLLTDDIEYLVNNYLDDLGSNRIAYISKEMKKTPEEIQEMLDIIKTLEPKPGCRFSSGKSVKYVIPDLTLEIIGDSFKLILNNNSTPKLMISSYYKALAKDVIDDEKVSEYFSDRLNSAINLIKNIEQRKSTIYNVAKTIVEKQKDFFIYGDKYMKPLTLSDIADMLQIHESTVSRAVNGKYILSPKGLFELKYFFCSGVGCGDEGVSSNSIKSFISEFINKEDPKKPLSDQKISEMLLDRGIDVKRRTIAKYRESLEIPASSKRRRF